MTATLRIGGLTPLTTIDFPGQLAAVVFCQGCPWRCRYCQNGHLLRQGDERNVIEWREVVAFLRRRRGLLDGVVFSGGEPTAQSGLGAAMDQVRDLGYRVGLHTAGCHPERLRRLLPRVDWIGLDVKGPAEDYAQLTGVAGSGALAWRSLDLLLASGRPYEVRVTAHERLLPAARLRELLAALRERGVERVAVQRCEWRRTLDPGLGPTRDPWEMLPDHPSESEGVARRVLRTDGGAGVIAQADSDQ